MKKLDWADERLQSLKRTLKMQICQTSSYHSSRYADIHGLTSGSTLNYFQHSFSSYVQKAGCFIASPKNMKFSARK
ncbi:hypothetical protein [Bacillus smithii]|uniref:hypothetical protein n=1 Tax=Bacillus smithii TaxID=1479 RepID=UPI0030C9246E